MSIKDNTIILSTTNSRYIPITNNLITTFNKFHPEIKFYLIGVNLTDEEKVSLRALHSNLTIIEDNAKFENYHHENGERQFHEKNYFYLKNTCSK